MRSVVIVGMLVLSAGLCHGQQPSVVKARPAGLTDSWAAAAGSSAEKTVPPSEAADHVRKAAAHLDAAGMKDEADRLRHLAKFRLAGRPQQVAFRMKILEVSRAKWRALGFSGVRAEGVGGVPFERYFDIATPERLEKLEAMRKDNLVRVLGEPTIVTLDGRNAHIAIAGSIPQAAQDHGLTGTEQVDYSTKVVLHPEVFGADKIRLQTCMEVCDSFDPFGKKVPVPRTCSTNTTVQLRFGQTLVFARRVQDREGQSPKTSDSQAGQGAEKTCEETVEAILITPELVIPMDSPKASPVSSVPVPTPASPSR